MEAFNFAINYVGKFSRYKARAEELSAKVDELEQDGEQHLLQIAWLRRELEKEKENLLAHLEECSRQAEASKTEIAELQKAVQREQENLDLMVRTIACELQDESELRRKLGRDLASYRIKKMGFPGAAGQRKGLGASKFILLGERDNPPERPVGMFLHIHKTAGASLSEFIRRNVDPERRVDLYQEPKLSRHEIASLISERGSSLDFVLGHFPYSDQIEALVDRPVIMFTVLRDPLDRAISLYYYFRQIANVNRFGKAIIDENIPLLEVLTNPFRVAPHYFDNGLVRLLATTPSDENTVCTQAMLDEAKHNLESKFGMIGFMEDIDDFVEKLSYAFCFKNEKLPRYNVTEKRESLACIPLQVQEIFEQRNKFDRELYGFARTLSIKWSKVSARV